MKITLKTLIILLLGLTILSCNATDSKKESSTTKTTQTSDPNYQVGIQFINDYLDFCNGSRLNTGILEWINNRADVTKDFKKELKRILDEAEKQDPEIGLGFDPILDAQDNPNKFEIDRTDYEYLVVKGVKWTDFKLSMKLKLKKDKWLVDGVGIINVPKNKRIKR